MLRTLVLLLVAVGLLIAALGTGHLALAWVSVALSAVVAALIVMRWRRRRDEPEVEPVVLLDDEPADALPGGDQTDDPARDVTPGEPSPQPVPVAAAEHGNPAVEAAPVASDQGAETGEDIEAGEEGVSGEPGEEDTDAADLLVVYELNDEVLVVDEYPRYHLTRCAWPDHERGERLPVREARELGFTPCNRCRPDAALARRHRAASATTGRS